MRLTIITNVLPWPLESGGAQAQYCILDELRKNHQITIIFTQDGHNTYRAMRELEGRWPEVRFEPFSYLRQMCYPRFVYDKAVRAFQLLFMPNSRRTFVERALKPYGVYFSKDFKRFVNRVLMESQAELVEVNFFPCLPMVRYIRHNVKTVFVHHEIRFVRNERLLQSVNSADKERLRMERIKKNEVTDLNQYDAVLSLTENDKQVLKAKGVHAPIYVSPASVKTELHAYSDWNGKLVFLGGYAHIPNKEGIDWFLSEVMPLIQNNSASLRIVGKGWPNSYATAYEDVELDGFIPNLYGGIRNCIMIVPILTGSGMRMKILEAASMGIPFVTTSVGVEGLEFFHEEACLIADSKEDFALAVERMIGDETLRKRLADNALTIFQEKYSARALAKRREEIYLEILREVGV